MRRLLKALAVLVVLLAGAVTAIVIHRLQQEHDIRGSSTVEYHPEPTPKPPRFSEVTDSIRAFLNASPKPGALQLKSAPPHPPW